MGFSGSGAWGCGIGKRLGYFVYLYVLSCEAFFYDPICDLDINHFFPQLVCFMSVATVFHSTSVIRFISCVLLHCSTMEYPTLE